MINLLNTQKFGLFLGIALFAASLPSQADAPAPRKSQANYEIRFMTMMIDHHMSAVLMGQLCVERAVHPELIALCEEMVATQLEEIATMQSWLADWYGITHEPQVKPGDLADIRKLSELTGAEFEIEFMETMIKHHLKAVMMGMHCVEKAYHPELIAMCQEMVAMQLHEIELMCGWLESWYDEECHVPGRFEKN